VRLGVGPVDLKVASRSHLESLATPALLSSFDAIWVGESRSEGVGGGLAAAAMLAQSVPIRVGAAIEAGLYHPVHMAEDIAVADLTSQGRLEILLQLGGSAASRYEVHWERDRLEEHLQVLLAALSGAHIRHRGKHLQVPAGIDANQPSPQRLALNPRPAQPVVPIWIEATETWMAETARNLGCGVAARWKAGMRVPVASGRWPGMVLCPAETPANDLLEAARDTAGYFLVDAATADDVRSAGRRLAGPLRMPEFPDWVNA
jgi:alkanesulfonate monooxygenase SsuD/methylene tetrahydromethanopterin reductase-like flavin-dependent oxidoreductase (luciferase family)